MMGTAGSSATSVHLYQSTGHDITADGKDMRTANLTTVRSHKNKNTIHIQNVSLIFIPSMYKYELRNGRRVGRVLRHLCTLCAHKDIDPARQYHRQGLQQVSVEYKSIVSPQDTFEGSLEAM